VLFRHFLASKMVRLYVVSYFIVTRSDICAVSVGCLRAAGPIGFSWRRTLQFFLRISYCYSLSPCSIAFLPFSFHFLERSDNSVHRFHKSFPSHQPDCLQRLLIVLGFLLLVVFFCSGFYYLIFLLMPSVISC